MIDQKRINRVMAAGMQAALAGERACAVVKGNLATPAPAYPYVSFTVASPRGARGTPGRLGCGRYAEAVTQVWSITAQSGDDNEALRIATALHSWFRVSGRLYLNDNGIAVVRAGGITSRDNLVSIRYEYRCGFDVTLGLTDAIGTEEPVIEAARFTQEQEGTT